MIFRLRIIIAVLLLSVSFLARSQVNCTVPESPVMTLVSVDPSTGNTNLGWALSPSTGIAAYIVYTYSNGDGIALDTVWNPSATSWSYFTTAAKYKSLSYVITAHRLSAVPGMPGCTSPLSNPLNTIFCQSALDTCRKLITLNWNSYADSPFKVTGYRILAGENGSPLAEIMSTGKDVTNAAISNFRTGTLYCFAIKALLENGTFSYSNKCCLETRMKKPPDWINADYATVNENSIDLSFTIDPASEIKTFSIERSTGNMADFEQIANLSSVGNKVIYSDHKADPVKINYYRLAAVNSCNNPIVWSNTASNIVLTMTNSGAAMNFSWNGYYRWLGSVSAYDLYINTGNGFEKMSSTSDTTLTFDFNQIMYQVSAPQVCFVVKGNESSNPYGISGQSASGALCMNPEEKITVPNVFTPNNDLRNDIFRPVLSFTPVSYHLIISERNGNVLFETKDFLQGWDGSGPWKNGNTGVCLWFLKLTTPSGRVITKTGTLTVIR